MLLVKDNFLCQLHSHPIHSFSRQKYQSPFSFAIVRRLDQKQCLTGKHSDHKTAKQDVFLLRVYGLPDTLNAPISVFGRCSALHSQCLRCLSQAFNCPRPPTCREIAISSRVFITYANIEKETNGTFRLLSLLSITVTLLFIGTGQIDSPVYTHSDSVTDG